MPAQAIAEQDKTGWETRLRAARYTPPSGDYDVDFLYEDVSFAIEKKTSAYEFPDADGSLIQDNGHGSRKFPLRVVFSGTNHDLEADVFLEALLEKGIGVLEHPMYGRANVIPFGEITRRDDLKTRANESVFDVTFRETILDLYPSSQEDRASAVRAKLEELEAAQAASLEAELDVSTASARSQVKGQIEDILAEAGKISVLGELAKRQSDVQELFEATYDSIDSSIDTLVSDPLTLAFQTARMIQYPAQALTAIEDRLDAYKDLASAIFSGDGAAVKTENEYRMKDHAGLNYIAGAVRSVVNNQFDTKTDALLSAETILGALEEASVWRDAAVDAVGIIDQGGPYQKTQELVALTTGYLVEISFTLKQERAIVLDRPRTIIDLAAELYGEVDSKLDFLIMSNNLTGSEIVELPRGKRIVYYL